ncbi:MAG: galactokinase [Fimbriimonadaceae bacterium]|nr:galactokinase [Fimbriimonadaceae bacterium]
MNEKIVSLFAEQFGGVPEVVAHAPGRINLIGEHTDYNDGFVFPCAIDLGITVALRHASSTRLFSKEMGSGKERDIREETKPDSWVKYPAGVAWAMNVKTNVEGVVASTLPAESGVSSSAAIELAFAVAWNHLESQGKSNLELALLSQKAENQYVGMNCGVMDQMASALGRKDHALLIDTRSLSTKTVPIPAGVAVVLCNTGKTRQLTQGAYNQRRRECEEACGEIGVDSLRDADLSQVERIVDPTVRRRARHVVTENERCQDFAKALSNGEFERIYSLMRASHESLRDDYEVSCIELDAMAESAWQSPGCLGARLTGAGFGGACVALVAEEMVEKFTKECEHLYRQRVKDFNPTLTVTRAAEGARVTEGLWDAVSER